MRTQHPLASALAWALSATFLLGACDHDDGAAPLIADLTLTPDEVDVGTMSNVDAKLTFEDEDGDAESVAVTLRVEGAEPLELSTALQGADGVTAGPAQVILVVLPTTAGEIGVELRMLDAKGHESNALTGTITAVDPGTDDCDTEGCAAAPLEGWLVVP